MQKVTGIKSVDFKVIAKGHGVVNYNGPINLKGKKTEYKNHTLPKLRGYTNLTGQTSEKGYEFKKEATDIDFKETPLYVSQNCIRHHLFRGDGLINLRSEEIAKNKNQLICSMTGLVRGYVIPQTEEKRTSALLLTDFVNDVNKNTGNFEQFSKSGSKKKEKTKSGEDKSSTLFSKTTFGDTEYIGYGSISIEQLQFISLDEEFGRKALVGFDNHKEGALLAEKITNYLKSLRPITEARAEYHQNYVRIGSIYKTGEAGILLNDAAIDILVNETLELIKQLSIRQAKGYMFVDEVLVDYNYGSSGKDMMRIRRSEGVIKSEKDTNYAVYFEGVAK
jgi:hypothetical protein